MPGTEPDGHNPWVAQSPFIERPDEHAPIGDELYCWMPGNADRQCGADCVAFEDRSLVEGSNLDTCKVLNSIRSISRSMSVQTQVKKTEQRQAFIREQPAPPEVR